MIFTPVLKEKGLSSAISGVEALVKKFKGKVLEMEDQGKEKMSFPIAKYKEGIYVFWKLSLPSESAVGFEAQLKLEKGVLRQLLIRGEDE